MKRTHFLNFSVCASLLFLAACGSNVKLDEAPVENRTATAIAPPTAAASASASASAGGNAASKGVAPVEITATGTAAAGPTGAVKIIYFDYDSFTIKPEFQSAVEAHARYMAANKARKLAVEGHTDERGGREYNLALGQKRAEAVRRALGLLGVTDAQVEAVSFGKEKPAAPGSDEASLAKNRRAELNYR